MSNRIVKLPSVESFGRLTPDKWLALKNLEESAELVVAFTDGGFLRREEYDGSEWWEYEPPFRVPETQKPFKLVKALSYYTQLLVDINYPMKATEE